MGPCTEYLKVAIHASKTAIPKTLSCFTGARKIFLSPFKLRHMHKPHFSAYFSAYSAFFPHFSAFFPEPADRIISPPAPLGRRNRPKRGGNLGGGFRTLTLDRNPNTQRPHVLTWVFDPHKPWVVKYTHF